MAEKRSRKPRRHWPDHPLVGRQITYRVGGNESKVQVVDVKAGPMFIDTSSFDRSNAAISGSLKLRLQHIDTGAEFWSPPVVWDRESDSQNSNKERGSNG